MSDSQTLETFVHPGLSLKASIFAFIGSTTAMTLVMMMLANLR